VSSTSPEFAEITGNVARPLWFTSGRDSSPYIFALSHSCSSTTSTASPLPRFTGVTPRSTAAPPFATASTLGSSRARVKYVSEFALRRGTRRCPWFPRRPRRRRVPPAMSSPLSLSLCHVGPVCQQTPSVSLSLSHLWSLCSRSCDDFVKFITRVL